MFTDFVRALLASVFLFAIILNAEAAERVAEKVPGVTIFYPDTWTDGTTYQNALEIVRIGSNARIDARILVYFEQRLDAAEAIERLAQVARPYADKASIVVLHGWPAIVAEIQGPLPRRRPDSPQLVGTMRSVAIAAGDRIYRIETVIEQGAATGVREEASAIENRVRFSMDGNSERSQSLLASIRTKSQTPVDIQPVRKPKSTTPPQTSTSPSATQSAGFAALLGGTGRGGELEVAVSPTGQSIVVASNGGVFSSQNGGATFTTTATGQQPANDRGDPSVAWAGSKTFYQSRLNINQPNPLVPATACSIALGSSSDLGRTFNWGLPLIQSCGTGGAAGCFPDQPHIAATPYFSFPSPDSIYMTWRHWTNVGTPPPSCQATSGRWTTQLICSPDGGQNWSAPAVVAGGVLSAGDFPRISADSFTYVVFTLPVTITLTSPPIAARDVYVHKFSDCASGLTPVSGFPRRVATLIPLTCPVPGLDRCNNGNELASPTITVSKINANQIHITYATSNNAGGDDVVVTDSWDGGLNWSTPEVVNDNVTTRRFMPWSCEGSGQIFVGYYDRRNSTTADNDLTDYYITSASKFASGSPFSIAPDDRLTPASDRQCSPTWTAVPRSANDLTACSTPPLTFTGTCTNLPIIACQINTPAATGPAPALPGGCGACNVLGSPGFGPALGVPRYGDYNGIGCGGGLVVAAWAAGTTLTGATTPNIQIYMRTRGVRLRPSEGTNHSTSLIQREAKTSAPSNFELIVPIGYTLTNFTRHNDWPGAPWTEDAIVILEPRSGQPRSTPLGASLIESSYRAAGTKNLEAMVRVRSGVPRWPQRLEHYYRSGADGQWYPLGQVRTQNGTLILGVTGDPALIQTARGETGNFEMLVPQGQRLVHYVRQNDQPGTPWTWLADVITPRSATSPTPISVAFMQSTYRPPETNIGNLEAVVRMRPTGPGAKDYLDFYSFDVSSRSWRLVGPVRIESGILDGVTGDPGMIQSTWGKPGNFELLVPVGGQVLHLFRNNQVSAQPWIVVGSIEPPNSAGVGGALGIQASPRAVTLIQSTYGAASSGIGNFEAIVQYTSSVPNARVLKTYYFDAETKRWNALGELKVNNAVVRGVSGL